jgi:phosphoribosylanthranilate isomerase
VQVGMFISQKDISELKGLTVIKEVVAGIELSATELEDHLDAYSEHCDFFLLNFSAEGHSWNDVESGHPYSPDFLKTLCKKYRIILNLDCQPDEVSSMVSEVNPYALGVHGGEEERVGVKSFDDLDAILDELEKK